MYNLYLYPEIWIGLARECSVTIHLAGLLCARLHHHGASDKAERMQSPGGSFEFEIDQAISFWPLPKTPSTALVSPFLSSSAAEGIKRD